MSSERRKLYEADIERLEEQIRDIERSRKNLVWALLFGVGLAPVAFFFSHVVALVLLVGGLSIFGCGHYIILMHVLEWRHSIERNRDVIDDLPDTP